MKNTKDDFQKALGRLPIDPEEKKHLQTLLPHLKGPETPILITRPSDCGKTNLAWTIHEMTEKSKEQYFSTKNPRFPVSDESRFTALLFGYEPGALPRGLGQGDLCKETWSIIFPPAKATWVMPRESR